MNEFDLNRELLRMVVIGKGSYKFSVLKNCIINLKGQCNLNSTVLLLKYLNDNLNTDTAKIKFSENVKEKDFTIDDAFEQYFSLLKICSCETKIDIKNLFELEYRKDFQRQIFNHWQGKNDTDINSKSFLEVFDDILQNGLRKYSHVFIKKIEELKHLYRAQEGLHFDNYGRMIPNPAQTDNRWNPAGKAFLYLGYNESEEVFDDTINMIEKTCFEELRLKAEQNVTICRFKLTKKSLKILNFCYEDFSYDEINSEFNRGFQSQVNKGLKEIKRKIATTKDFIKEHMNKEIRKVKNNGTFKKENKMFTEIYLVKLLMKGIDEAVFLPLSENDPNRDAYKRFHRLSEYLIDQGYAGAIYRSTRMNLIGQQGKNVVLFEKDFANYIDNSMLYYHYDGEKYITVSNIPN